MKTMFCVYELYCIFANLKNRYCKPIFVSHLVKVYENMIKGLKKLDKFRLHIIMSDVIWSHITVHFSCLMRSCYKTRKE